jgi:DNA mismatch endonuclease (patch repair protein)
VDRVTRQVRSKIMSLVGSRGNRTTERRMSALLWSSGLRGYRKHWRITGTPDFAWPRSKVALFVDGCFWHGCPHCCRYSKSNKPFWNLKVKNNRARDRRVAAKLRRQGWSVVRVWECAVKKPATLARIKRALESRT